MLFTSASGNGDKFRGLEAACLLLSVRRRQAISEHCAPEDKYKEDKRKELLNPGPGAAAMRWQAAEPARLQLELQLCISNTKMGLSSSDSID